MSSMPTLTDHAEEHRVSRASFEALRDAQRDGSRYELLAGEVLVTPSPSFLHQYAAGELFALWMARTPPCNPTCSSRRGPPSPRRPCPWLRCSWWRSSLPPPGDVTWAPSGTPMPGRVSRTLGRGTRDAIRHRLSAGR